MITQEYLLNFPDSWESVIGINLFYNQKSRTELVQTKTKFKNVKKLAENYMSQLPD